MAYFVLVKYTILFYRPIVYSNWRIRIRITQRNYLKNETLYKRNMLQCSSQYWHFLIVNRFENRLELVNISVSFMSMRLWQIDICIEIVLFVDSAIDFYLKSHKSANNATFVYFEKKNQHNNRLSTTQEAMLAVQIWQRAANWLQVKHLELRIPLWIDVILKMIHFLNK